MNSSENTTVTLEQRVVKIEQRNLRVEEDKAWETSWMRKLVIAGLTYIVIVVFFLVADLPQPYINAIVPAVAFIISTLTVGVVKRWWLSKQIVNK